MRKERLCNPRIRLKPSLKYVQNIQALKSCYLAKYPILSCSKGHLGLLNRRSSKIEDCKVKERVSGGASADHAKPKLLSLAAQS